VSTRTWQRKPLLADPMLRYGLLVGGLAYLVAAIWSVEIDIARLQEGLPRGLKFLAGFLPPDFTTRGDEIVSGVLESIWMALVSTAVGILVSVPIALGASSNIAPRPVYLLCRGLVAVARSFQAIILAVLFVALFGFGPFAGFMTLVVTTVGFFAKLLAEEIEEISTRPAEAIESVGASGPQWLVWAVWPQITPRFVGLSLYRLDINFRESSIVGIVGGGGIGATLTTAFDRYEFDSAAAILLVIIAIVLFVEWTSGLIRQRVQ
jgi:phosphonate transport system permease protein